MLHYYALAISHAWGKSVFFVRNHVIGIVMTWLGAFLVVSIVAPEVGRSVVNLVADPQQIDQLAWAISLLFAGCVVLICVFVVNFVIASPTIFYAQESELCRLRQLLDTDSYKRAAIAKLGEFAREGNVIKQVLASGTTPSQVGQLMAMAWKQKVEQHLEKSFGPAAAAVFANPTSTYTSRNGQPGDPLSQMHTFSASLTEAIRTANAMPVIAEGVGDVGQ